MKQQWLWGGVVIIIFITIKLSLTIMTSQASARLIQKCNGFSHCQTTNTVSLSLLTYTLYLPFITGSGHEVTSTPTATAAPIPTVTITPTPTLTVTITLTPKPPMTVTPTSTVMITNTATAMATHPATITPIATRPATITPTATLMPIINCNPSNGSGGFTGGVYTTTVAGLKAIVIVGADYDPQQPTYLGFFLHGDGGNYYRFTDPQDKVTQFIQQHHWILVSPQSPNGGARWWTEYWESDFVPQMRAVMEEMFTKYNICRNVLFGASVSGGSEFVTNYFFPQAGADYPAHFVLNCGGDVWLWEAQQQISALSQQPQVKTRASFDFVYGTNDYLYNTIQKAIRIYSNAGFTVNIDETAGMGHCDSWHSDGFPSADEKISIHWDKIARELKIY